MTRWARVIPLLLVTAGCAPDHACDPDQIYDNTLCYARMPDAAKPVVDAAGDAGGDGGAACTDADRTAAFGATCTTVADCKCGLDYCATYMGKSTCTHTGCLADPSVCPSGWSCLDLSVFQKGLPDVCVKM